MTEQKGSVLVLLRPYIPFRVVVCLSFVLSVLAFTSTQMTRVASTHAASPPYIIRTVPTNANASLDVIDVPHGRVYLYSPEADMLGIMNPRNGVLLRTLTISGTVSSVLPDEQAGRAYVSDSSANTVSIIDAPTGMIARTLTIGHAPLHLAVYQDHLFVADSQDDTITMVRVPDGRVLKTLSSAGSTTQLLVDQAHGLVVAGSAGGLRIFDARTGALVHAVNVPGPSLMAVLARPARIIVITAAPAGTFSCTVRVIDTLRGRLIATESVRGVAEAVATDPRRGTIILGSTDEDANALGYIGRLTLIDASTGALLRTIVQGNRIADVVADTTNDHLFVSEQGLNAGNPLRVYNLATLGYLDSIAVSTAPTRLVVDPLTQSLFAAGGNTVTIVSTPHWRTTRVDVGAGSQPGAVADAARSGRAFVLDRASDRVSVINVAAGRVVRTTRVGRTPFAVAVDDRVGVVAVTNDRDATVSLLDARTGLVLKTIGVGGHPRAVAVDAIAHRAIVANATGNSVSVIDLVHHRLVRTLAVGRTPVAIAVDASRGRAFVVDRDDSAVTVVDTRRGRVIGTRQVGANPVAIALDTRAGRVYVANAGAQTISVLHETDTLAEPDVRLGVPTALAVSNRSGRVMVALAPSATSPSDLYPPAQTNGAVLLGSTGGAQAGLSRIGYMPLVGNGAHAVAWDDTRDVALVTNALDATVTALDGSTGATLTSLSVGADPVSIATDPHSGRAIIVNQGGDSVSLVDDGALGH